VDGGPSIPPPLGRRALLTRQHAKEIIHHWDQKITRLRHQVDELEEHNARLAVALADAVRMCDEGAAVGREPAPISLHIANVGRFLLSQVDSLRSQVLLAWRSVAFSVAHLALPYRRKIKPSVGWPFEPGLDGPTSIGCMAEAPPNTEHSPVSAHSICGEDDEPKG
jgi:hypothetical protein